MSKIRRIFTVGYRLSIIREAERASRTETFRKYLFAPSMLVSWRRKYLTPGIERLKPQYTYYRTHIGKYCFWKKTTHIFCDSKNLAQEKILGEFLRKDANFELSSKTEAGSAKEQPAKNNLNSS
jgi:hypothetical protein